MVECCVGRSLLERQGGALCRDLQQDFVKGGNGRVQAGSAGGLFGALAGVPEAFGLRPPLHDATRQRVAVPGIQDAAALEFLKDPRRFTGFGPEKHARAAGAEDAVDFAGDDEAAEAFAHGSQVQVGGAQAVRECFARLRWEETDIGERTHLGLSLDLGQTRAAAHEEKQDVRVREIEPGGGGENRVERVGQPEIP